MDMNIVVIVSGRCIKRNTYRTPKTCARSMYARPLLRTQNWSSLPLHPGRGNDSEDSLESSWVWLDCCSCSYSSTERLERVSGDKGRIGAESGTEREQWLISNFSGFVPSNLDVAATLSYLRSSISTLVRLALSSSTSDFGPSRLILCRNATQDPRHRNCHV